MSSIEYYLRGHHVWPRFEMERISRRKMFAMFLLGACITANSVAYAGLSERQPAAKKVDSPILTPAASLPERSRVLARDGTELAILFSDHNRDVVKLEEVSQVFIDAVVASEDRRFFQHAGADLKGIARALLKNLESGEIEQGGSTITQQYVRNVYLDRSQTLERKIKELRLAIELEKQWSKNQILEAYLNTVYFGEGSYGVQAAAETYFSTSASQLRPEQAALLVSLIPSPNRSPFDDPEQAVKLRNAVIDRMLREGVITEEEATHLKQTPLGLMPSKADTIRMAPHFVELVKKRLLAEPALGKTKRDRYDTLFAGGLTIRTSLDPRLQRIAEDAGSRLPGGVPESAVVLMDPHTGEVLAYRGGSDFDQNKFDLVSQAKRQPGSSFKTFGLVAALEAGIPPSLTVPGSSRCSFRISSWETWKVENYGGAGYGSMSLADATAKSVNCAYASLVTRHIEPSDVVETARRMGIESRLDTNPSVILGGLTHGVSPMEMARAYGTLAADGLRADARPILEVTDATGRVLLRSEPTSERAMSQNVARAATDTLARVITKGTAKKAAFAWPAAGKTGTTQLNSDAWFVGYTQKLVCAVWVGHREGAVSMPGVTGGNTAAQIWRTVMVAAHEGLGEPVSFSEPDLSQFTGGKKKVSGGTSPSVSGQTAGTDAVSDVGAAVPATQQGEPVTQTQEAPASPGASDPPADQGSTKKKGGGSKK